MRWLMRVSIDGGWSRADHLEVTIHFDWWVFTCWCSGGNDWLWLMDDHVLILWKLNFALSVVWAAYLTRANPRKGDCRISIFKTMLIMFRITMFRRTTQVCCRTTMWTCGSIWTWYVLPACPHAELCKQGRIVSIIIYYGITTTITCWCPWGPQSP